MKVPICNNYIDCQKKHNQDSLSAISLTILGWSVKFCA